MPIHIKAQEGEVARYVLLPGDPGRARFIADSFLENATCYNEYRQLLGYSGTYRGLPVSVQATGMGCPSAAIVVTELMDLGAEVMMRIGSCGAIHPELNLSDLVVVTSACAVDGSIRALAGIDGYAPTADFDIARFAFEQARQTGLAVKAGSVATCDLFYNHPPNLVATLSGFGVLAMEMEAAMVLTLAAMRGKKAGCLLTVSDLVQSLTRAPEDKIRQGEEEMVRVALETFHRLDRQGAKWPVTA